MITCTRKIEFDAAHRVRNHASKCKMLHGHRYVVEVTFSIPELDELGMVVDFGIIKERLGAWIDKHWDHTAILIKDDKELGRSLTEYTGQEVYYMHENPTAENMAKYLLHDICPKLFTDIKGLCCVKIRLYETPNCYAEAAIS
jgi:6-pyruvoyltetrahydropterin/6-carboxytetrahydropterin synthase